MFECICTHIHRYVCVSVCIILIYKSTTFMCWLICLYAHLQANINTRYVIHTYIPKHREREGESIHILHTHIQIQIHGKHLLTLNFVICAVNTYTSMHTYAIHYHTQSLALSLCSTFTLFCTLFGNFKYCFHGKYNHISKCNCEWICMYMCVCVCVSIW